MSSIPGAVGDSSRELGVTGGTTERESENKSEIDASGGGNALIDDASKAPPPPPRGRSGPKKGILKSVDTSAKVEEDKIPLAKRAYTPTTRLAKMLEPYVEEPSDSSVYEGGEESRTSTARSMATQLMRSLGGKGNGPALTVVKAETSKQRARRRWSMAASGALASGISRRRPRTRTVCYGCCDYNERTSTCTLNASSSFMRGWDGLMVSLLVYTALVTPYEAAFLSNATILWLFVVNRLVDAGFGTDMILQFFLPFFDEGTQQDVDNLWRIAKRYLSGWFWIDLASIVPFAEIVEAASGGTVDVASIRIIRIIRILRLVKLLRVLRASRILVRWRNQIGLSFAVLQLVQFLVVMLVIAHWSACAFFLSASLTAELYDGVSWVTAEGLERSPPFDQYVSSIYWSITMATTVGFGDIAPINTGERLFACVLILVGGGLYAYLIGGIFQIVSNLDPATAAFRSNMDNLNRYAEEISLPHPMRQELRDYFTHAAGMMRHQFFRGVLKTMSPMLRGRVAMHLHRGWVARVPFFNAANPAERFAFITAVAVGLEPGVFAALEPVQRSGDVVDRMYIIQRGMASSRGRIIGRGHFFGEEMILTKARCIATVRALTFLDVFYLRKDRLEEILASGDFEATRKRIRYAVIRMALRRELLKCVAISRIQQTLLGQLVGGAAAASSASAAPTPAHKRDTLPRVGTSVDEAINNRNDYVDLESERMHKMDDPGRILADFALTSRRGLSVSRSGRLKPVAEIDEEEEKKQKTSEEVEKSEKSNKQKVWNVEPEQLSQLDHEPEEVKLQNKSSGVVGPTPQNISSGAAATPQNISSGAAPTPQNMSSGAAATLASASGVVSAPNASQGAPDKYVAVSNSETFPIMSDSDSETEHVISGAAATSSLPVTVQAAVEETPEVAATMGLTSRARKEDDERSKIEREARRVARRSSRNPEAARTYYSQFAESLPPLARMMSRASLLQLNPNLTEDAAGALAAYDEADWTGDVAQGMDEEDDDDDDESVDVLEQVERVMGNIDSSTNTSSATKQQDQDSLKRARRSSEDEEEEDDDFMHASVADANQGGVGYGMGAHGMGSKTPSFAGMDMLGERRKKKRKPFSSSSSFSSKTSTSALKKSHTMAPSSLRSTSAAFSASFRNTQKAQAARNKQLAKAVLQLARDVRHIGRQASWGLEDRANMQRAVDRLNHQIEALRMQFETRQGSKERLEDDIYMEKESPTSIGHVPLSSSRSSNSQWLPVFTALTSVLAAVMATAALAVVASK